MAVVSGKTLLPSDIAALEAAYTIAATHANPLPTGPTDSAWTFETFKELMAAVGKLLADSERKNS